MTGLNRNAWCHRQLTASQDDLIACAPAAKSPTLLQGWHVWWPTILYYSIQILQTLLVLSRVTRLQLNLLLGAACNTVPRIFPLISILWPNFLPNFTAAISHGEHYLQIHIPHFNNLYVQSFLTALISYTEPILTAAPPLGVGRAWKRTSF